MQHYNGAWDIWLTMLCTNLEHEVTWVKQHPLRTTKNIFDMLFVKKKAPQARLDERLLVRISAVLEIMG